MSVARGYAASKCSIDPWMFSLAQRCHRDVAVMIAALGVWGTATAWPDLIVAGIMAALFLYSSAQILSQAWRERQDAVGGPVEVLR